MYVCICMHIYYTHERMHICTTSQYNTNTVSTRTPTHNATYICAVCTNYAYQRTCTWYTSFLPIHECISRSKHTNTLCIPSHTYCTYLLHTLIYRLHTRCIPTHQRTYALQYAYVLVLMVCGIRALVYMVCWYA